MSATIGFVFCCLSPNILTFPFAFKLSPRMVMPSFQSVPSIRVDLLDAPPRSLSSSSTLDIRDISSQVKLWPDLLAEDFLFDDVDDVLYLEDDPLQDVPSFPVGHRPPLFILQAHRSRLPFPIRQEAFELGDFCVDEDDACPLLTAPTVPRMKMMMMEQLYVQKWVDTLTSDGPPKHMPWSCEKPATERKWIAAGSIFPSDMMKSSTEQDAAKQPFGNRYLTPADRVSHSSKLCSFSEASAPISTLSDSATSRSHIPVKSASADPRMLRGESKNFSPQSTSEVSQASSPPTLPPSGLPTRAKVIKSDAPLAARRGKSLGGLILQGSVLEQLEYPDIPTAFRGSPSVWSPQFDTFAIPSFTDHQSMLSDLKLKGAALRSGVSTYNPENSYQYPEVALNADEWTFTRGPTTFDDNSGLASDEVPKEIPGPSVFLPDGPPTPARRLSSTARPGFVSRPHSTPTLRSPIKRSSDPPGTPLPPRPALVNPSTPPHVRGILKKVKSVRFEDMVVKETSSVMCCPQTSAERPSSQSSAALTRRPCTPLSITTKPRVPVEETPMFVKNAEETRRAPRPRPTPKRTKPNRKPELMHHDAGSSLEVSKSILATASIERPCRIAHVKRNTSPEGLSTSESDVRRGEGTAKSRLSAPLRNIFRFR